MFDNIVSNKYFVIALVITVIVVLYLYSRKKSCNIEGMQNVDLLRTPPKIDEMPWANDYETGKYRNIDKHPKKHNKKINKNNYLKRKDLLYRQYAKHDNDNIDIHKRKRQNQSNISNPQRGKVYWESDSQILGQCQPCICPKNDESDSSSSEEDNYPIKKNKSKRRQKN